MLLDALRDSGSLRRFIPFDVDSGVLNAAGSAIEREYPGIEIDAVCGDFEEHLGKIPRVGRRLVVFLGSTIGNLTTGPRKDFLTALSDTLQPGDSLLLGTDLVKDAGRLVRAYDDSAASQRSSTATCSRWSIGNSTPISISTRSSTSPGGTPMRSASRCGCAPSSVQRVRIAALDLAVEFAAGEEMLTEVSCKFRPDGVEDELAAAGLRRTHWWTDPAGDFGLSLSTK